MDGSFSKILIIFGVVLVVTGLFPSMVGKIPFIGKLPGDIYIRKENFSFYFPITTSLLISILLTLFMQLFGRK